MLCSHVLSDYNLSNFSSTKAGKMKEWKHRDSENETKEMHDTEAGKFRKNFKQNWIEKRHIRS